MQWCPKVVTYCCSQVVVVFYIFKYDIICLETVFCYVDLTVASGTIIPNH